MVKDRSEVVTNQCQLFEHPLCGHFDFATGTPGRGGSQFDHLALQLLDRGGFGFQVGPRLVEQLERFVKASDFDVPLRQFLMQVPIATRRAGGQRGSVCNELFNYGDGSREVLAFGQSVRLFEEIVHRETLRIAVRPDTVLLDSSLSY